MLHLGKDKEGMRHGVYTRLAVMNGNPSWEREGDSDSEIERERERGGIISGSRGDVNEIALINLGLRERQRGREKQSAFRLLIWKGNVL